jgi:hypothetical protein
MVATAFSACVGERRERGSEEGEAGRWVQPRNLNDLEIVNFVQTWFAPKVSFLSSKSLDKNIGR